MTREQDWRIHEYMGNDLSQWKNEDGTYSNHLNWYNIPHYSTTGEGAGLVMDAFQEIGGVEIGAYGARNGAKWTEVRHLLNSGQEIKVTDTSAPQALANAYISAMEERDNG